MARARTGTLETVKDASGRTYYRGKVRLQDGSRARIEIPEPKCLSKTASKDFVGWAQEEEDSTHAIYNARVGKQTRSEAVVPGADGETCDAFYKRYNAHKRELGHSAARDAMSAWRVWISPKIGPKPIASVTADDIEDIRDALDAAIQAWTREGRGRGRLSGKSGMNIWSALTSAFKAATSSKRRDLRVLARKPNPCVGVEPPGDRSSRKPRRKPFLYPKEAAALLACPDVPLEWREVYAISVMTYLRPGELRVLTWADVDLEGGLIHISKAWDYAAETVKPPKTRNGIRKVPIEPALAPLLREMHDRGVEPSGLVVPALAAFNEDLLAAQLREHLEDAGITRAELALNTTTHAPVNFRSWRDSGLTWLAMTGLGVDKIMRRAGHDAVQTTMGYVKQAEDLGGDLGVPFGPLPLADWATQRATLAAKSAQVGGTVHYLKCEGRDLKRKRSAALRERS